MNTKHIVIVLVFCSCYFSLVNTGKTRTTRGKSGPKCGSGPQCLGNGQAECVNSKCECKKGKGLGQFICIRHDESFCAVFNDPMTIGFDGTHIKIPLMFKFSGTRIMSRTCRETDDNEVIATDGQCFMKIMGWGERRLGKTFLGGIEVAISIYSRGKFYHHATQITATARGKEYKFTEGGNKVPWGGTQFTGPVETDIPGHETIRTVYDEVDNFARLLVGACGTEVGIRGVQETGDPLKTASGIYIKVKDGCQARFPQCKNNLCIPPIGKGPSIQEQLQDLSYEVGKTVSRETLALYKVLKSDVVQVFPKASDSLQALTDTCQQCDDRRLVDAIESCVSLIHDVNFFNCYDRTKDGTKILELFRSCIFSICDRKVEVCEEVHEIVKKTRCPKEEIAKYFTQEMCKFN